MTGRPPRVDAPDAPASAPIRIAVADDHPVVREGLVAMLETQPDFAVVGVARSGAEALALATSHAVDVLLLDLEMPELDGVEVLRRLRAAGAPTRVIVFTVFDTDERIIGAVEAGAAGYLLKGAPRAEIFAAVRVVAAGGSLLAPVAASTVLGRVRSGAREEEPPRAPVLTPRERAVLEQLARGLGNKQIAAALGISERTVKFHVSAVFTKLGAANRTEAVLHAAQAGLITI
ncbi:MAG: response regulator transcription factor [Gemmatimonadaceae bacterium]|nr:response regulator transcription factor [Gemmatimonadaceae bacterium]